MKYYIKTILAVAIASTLFVGCEATKNANNSQKGTVIGAAGGAILGAIIGNNVGDNDNSELGAVIGGVVGGATGAIIGKKMDKQAQQIENEIPGAQVERIDDGIVVTFDENSGVYFDTDKSNINARSQETLNKLAGVLMEYPDTNVLVVGHTDSTGSAEYNLSLSQRRAESVTGYFVNTKGLSSGRFTTRWFGESQPAYTNDTPEGRAKNRRVQLAILPNEQMIEDAERESQGGN